MRRPLAVLLAALLATTPSAAQSPDLPSRPADRLVSAAALRGDVAILRRAFEALHPGLDRYTTASQRDSLWRSLDAAFARDRTLGDAFLEFGRLTAALQCGHTYPNFYNQRDSVAAALFASSPLLPFRFRWLDGRMVVLEATPADPRLPRGTEILAVDGRPTPQILASLLPLVRADGANRDKRVALLEVRGLDRYETFDVWYARVFPATTRTVRLNVRRPDGRQAVIEVAAASQADREAARAREAGTPSRSDSLWQFRWATPATAVLQMDGWGLYNSTWDWRGWLDARLQEVADRQGDLIVDLRRNEGGIDVGHRILARYLDAPLPIADYGRFTRYRTAPADLRPYLDTWDRRFDDWGAAAVPADSGFFRLQRNDEDAPIAPLAPRLRGRLYVLVGPENSSATFQFAHLVQHHRLGTLIGQPTGGNQRGINGGAFYFVRLPGSGLEVDLPLIATRPVTPRPNAGLTPDVAVPDRRADLVAGRDRALETALRLSAAGRPR